MKSLRTITAVFLLVTACGGSAQQEALAEAESARTGAEAQVAQLEARVAELEAQVAATEAEQKAEESAAADLPDIAELVRKYGLDPLSTSEAAETFASLTIRPSALDALGLMLEELGFPSSTMSRIGNTRALDGTLEAEGEKATAYWTYHPDDGLSIVIERIEQ